jgi:predicted transcriptional regulator
MTKKKEHAEGKLLTETELELMNILWSLGQGSVHEVMAKLSAERNLAYTSVSTILRILEQKKFVRSEKEGRGHIYCPMISKEKYEGTSLQNLVKNVFNGTPSAMVRRLLETSDLSDEELKSIRSLLNERSH